MRQKKLRESTASLEAWDEHAGSSGQVSEFLRRGQRAYPEVKRRDQRLLKEAIEFLLNAEGTNDPEGTLKALYVLYQEIDRHAEYIKPGEREFFPALKRARTLERFLEGFKYIYYILLRAQDRISLSSAFGVFWDGCVEYLRKCGYGDKQIQGAFGEGALFYRQSFNFWRREFKDEEEGFLVMLAYFKACFGIEGNDEYCKVSGTREETYDWKRMKACYEKLKDWTAKEIVVQEPVYEEWSEENKSLLRQRIEAYHRASKAEKLKRDRVLENIRRRNEQLRRAPLAEAS